MTVEEMLYRVSSRELSEWMAYEQAFGPIGPRYDSELLAGIHEQMQFANKMTGGEEYPEPRKVPRPTEFFLPPEDEEVMSVEEFNRQFDDD